MSPQPGSKPRPLVTPAPGSHLESLLEQLEAAKTAEAEAAARTKTINDGIKAEAVMQAMAEYRLEQPPKSVRVTGSATRPAYDVRWVPQTTIAVTPIQEQAPELFATLAAGGFVKRGGHWETRKAAS